MEYPEKKIEILYNKIIIITNNYGLTMSFKTVTLKETLNSGDLEGCNLCEPNHYKEAEKSYGMTTMILIND